MKVANIPFKTVKKSETPKDLRQDLDTTNQQLTNINKQLGELKIDGGSFINVNNKI